MVTQVVGLPLIEAAPLAEDQPRVLTSAGAGEAGVDDPLHRIEEILARQRDIVRTGLGEDRVCRVAESLLGGQVRKARHALSQHHARRPRRQLRRDGQL